MSDTCCSCHGAQSGLCDDCCECETLTFKALNERVQRLEAQNAIMLKALEIIKGRPCCPEHAEHPTGECPEFVAEDAICKVLIFRDSQ